MCSESKLNFIQFTELVYSIILVITAPPSQAQKRSDQDYNVRNSRKIGENFTVLVGNIETSSFAMLPSHSVKTFLVGS